MAEDPEKQAEGVEEAVESASAADPASSEPEAAPSTDSPQGSSSEDDATASSASDEGPVAEEASDDAEADEELASADAEEAPAADASEDAEEAPAADASEEPEPEAAAAEEEPVAEEKPAKAAAKPKRADRAASTPRRQRERKEREPGAPAPVVRAQAKYVRSSARKARLVCDHIRGKSVVEARAILAVTPRAIARDWSKLLESAVANAEHNHELVGEDLVVKAVHADEGPTIKRFRPRAMGRATRIRKRTSHLTILLTPKD
jgi:ribosomal protein L22